MVILALLAVNFLGRLALDFVAQRRGRERDADGDQEDEKRAGTVGDG